MNGYNNNQNGAIWGTLGYVSSTTTTTVHKYPGLSEYKLRQCERREHRHRPSWVTYAVELMIVLLQAYSPVKQPNKQLTTMRNLTVCFLSFFFILRTI